MSVDIAEIERRVERGAALLDSLNPGWHERFDLNGFVSVACCKCAADRGLERGDGWDIVQELLGVEVCEHGFNCYGEICRNGRFDDEEIVSAWKRLILSRRNPPLTLPPKPAVVAIQDMALAK